MSNNANAPKCEACGRATYMRSWTQAEPVWRCQQCARGASEAVVAHLVLDDAIATLTRERDEARRERDEWKANHDNQLAIKRAVLDRPDLADQSRSVQALIAERDQLKARAEKAEGNARWFVKVGIPLPLEVHRNEWMDRAKPYEEKQP